MSPLCATHIDVKSAKETHFCIRGLRPPHQIRRQNRCPYGSNSLATSSAISFANGHQLRSVIGDNLGGPNGCAIPLNRTTLLHTPLSVPSKMSRHFRQQVGSTCYAVPSILRTKLVPNLYTTGPQAVPFLVNHPRKFAGTIVAKCVHITPKNGVTGHNFWFVWGQG